MSSAPMGALKHNLKGQKFGKLEPICVFGANKRGLATWLCACECGSLTVTAYTNLLSGYTKSCGCLHAEVLARRNFKHGLTNTSVYRAFHDAKTRCTNPNRACSKRYQQELGVEFLLESPEKLKAEIGDRPTGYTLERINNLGPYAHGNVKWATRSEQMHNRERFFRRFCKAGHALTPDNVIETKSAKRKYGTIRHCKQCAEARTGV